MHRPNLVVLIREMEQKPDWLDMQLVEEGAAYERNATANLSPFLIRGAFIATFLNKYSALPMALTGTLGQATAARRVKETRDLLCHDRTARRARSPRAGVQGRGDGAADALDGARQRAVAAGHVGRRNLRHADPAARPDAWRDSIPVYFMSQEVLAKGRTSFTWLERGRVELARYRCYLLGLPEDLLADTPHEIVRIWRTRSATLRYEYDDVVCGGPLRATMEAELSKDMSPKGQVKRRLEYSVSRVFFVKAFLAGDEARAANVGVPGETPRPPDLWRDDARHCGAHGGLSRRLAAARHPPFGGPPSRSADRAPARRLWPRRIHLERGELQTPPRRS